MHGGQSYTFIIATSMNSEIIRTARCILLIQDAAITISVGERPVKREGKGFSPPFSPVLLRPIWPKCPAIPLIEPNPTPDAFTTEGIEAMDTTWTLDALLLPCITL